MPATTPLRRRRRSPHKGSGGLSNGNPHTPLLAAWLIRISLCLGLHRKPNRMQLPDILENDGFTSLTGIEPPMKADEDGDLSYDRKRIARLTEAKIIAMFENRLEELESQPWPDDLPLIRNVDLFGRRLGFNEADKAILRLALVLESFRPFRSFFDRLSVEIDRQQLIDVLVSLSGAPHADIVAALQLDAPLLASGILTVDTSGTTFIESVFGMLDGLASQLLIPEISEERLIGHFLRPASMGSLGLSAFPHLNSDILTVLPYLRNALAARESGINVLFYGVPGTGKTELAKVLAQKLEASLYEVSFSDSSGDPIKGRERLRAYNLCQRLSSSMPKTILMFDEVEDVFPSSFSGFFRILLGGGAKEESGKAWINRTLEHNPMPAIWITNDADIDPAYLRRFDYSIQFPIPPQSVRMAIARQHFAEFSPGEDWLARIAANEQTSPAQYERAARVAHLVAPDDQGHALSISEQTLDRSATLLGQKRTPARKTLRTRYDLSFVNADIDLPKVIAGLGHRPRGTFCFYGPAGTGKSELGRHIADAIDKPVLLRRASDILSMWVGEAERNIARMFSEARQREAVLILDEADSFLADRRDAQTSWEVTQVNELLTQMEAFEGIFICTTNLMQKLDQASLRRFAFKVKFDYLNAQQRETMFLNELARLGGDVGTATSWLAHVERLSQLTPGDFAVAARQYELWGTSPSAGELYEQLYKECVAKGTPMRSIGFTA